MKAFRAPALLLAAVILPVYGKSADWALMYQTHAHAYGRSDTTSWYVGRHTVSVTGPILRAWTLLSFTRPQLENGTFHYFHYRSVKSLVYVNCVTQRLATAEDVLFQKPMGAGKAIKHIIYPKPIHWDALHKESAALCKGTGIKYVPIPDVTITSRLRFAGRAFTQMKISPARSDVLVATATPISTPKGIGPFGVYTFSLSDPNRPRKLGFFPVLDASELLLSPDGLTAYALAPPFAGNPNNQKYYGAFVLNVANPKQPRLITRIIGSFFSMGLSKGGQDLFLQEWHRAWVSEDTAVAQLRAYRLRDGVPQSYCTVNLGPHQLATITTFAYSFFDFVDNPYLGLDNRGTEFLVLDIVDPCKPHILSDILDQYIDRLVNNAIMVAVPKREHAGVATEGFC